MGRFGSGFRSGMVEALLVPLAFAALGLGWWGVMGRAQSPSHAYFRSVSDRGDTWLIDGFNVVAVAMLGGRDRSDWWGAPQRAKLLSRADGFEDERASLFVVFDGERATTPDEAGGRVQSVFAPSADDWLLAEVRRADEPGRIVLVTADRRLANRARHHGARIVSPREFLGRCGPDPEWGDKTSI